MLAVVICFNFLVQFEAPLIIGHPGKPFDAIEVVVDKVGIMVAILHILNVCIDQFQTADSVGGIRDQFDHKLLKGSLPSCT